MPRLLFVLVCVLLSLAACRGGGTSGEGDSTAVAAGTYLNHGPEATYVGKEACRTCHASQYESFVASQMGRSFRAATRANSTADWGVARPIRDEANDLWYLPFVRGDSMFVMEYRLAGRDTVHRRVEKIDYIVGSGHHTNSHMRDENGYVYQIPVTWYAQEKRWDLPPGFRGNPDNRFRRPIPEACMTCHNAMPGFVAGSENKFDHVPLGIDCERCHGPGSIHVAQKQAGQIVDISKEVDYTIVNPAKLSPELQMNVCERCHMQATAVYRDGKGPADFRPGMRLADVMTVFEVRDADSTARFRMAAHPDRLRMSDCFTATYDPARGFAPMTCLTCHDPHKAVEAVDYNATCRTCHGGPATPPPGAAPASAPSTPPAGSGSAPACPLPEVKANPAADCAGCHMPTSGTWDIPHVAITDHYIRVPEGETRGPSRGGRGAPAHGAGSGTVAPARVDSLRRMVRLAAVVPASPTDRDVAEGFMSYYEEVTNRPGLLDSADLRLQRALRTASEQTLGRSLVRLRFLQGDFAAVRALAPTVDGADPDAWTLYRIGEAFVKAPDPTTALGYLKRAVDKAPFHLRFRQVLASTYGAAGQFDASLAAYDALLAEDPTFEDALNNRGFVHLQRGNLAAAEADFLGALRLAPNLEMALANVTSLYANTGRIDVAQAYAERLVRHVPGNPQYRQFLDALRGAAR